MRAAFSHSRRIDSNWARDAVRKRPNSIVPRIDSHSESRGDSCREVSPSDQRIRSAAEALGQSDILRSQRHDPFLSDRSGRRPAGHHTLAVIATATRRREISVQLPLQNLLLNPVIAAGTAALAAAEMAGDKMKTAPDRIVPIGLAVRSITAAYAGAALAPGGKRAFGAAVAVGTALASSYFGWRLRCAVMRRYGQTATGFVEDAIVFASGLATANPRLIAGKV